MPNTDIQADQLARVTMPEFDSAINARYYDTVAPQYDHAMASSATDQAVRDAFYAHVAASIAPDATLLDFGCGTGIDAKWYAARGNTVIAYDHSQGMMERLQERCADDIASRRIVPLCSPFEECPELLRAHTPVDAIVANFAVINHFPDLRVLRDLFAGLLRPSGILIASTLNPFYWRDMRGRGWWRALRAAPEYGSIRFTGSGGPTYRHFGWHLSRHMAPQFVKTGQASAATLTSIPSLTRQPILANAAVRLERSGWRRFPLNRIGNFLFVTYRRVG
jgi:2-polyprenyl-3-methyl-5-hydroxy-6-metoxy-1,4-benzoquinol methylase